MQPFLAITATPRDGYFFIPFRSSRIANHRARNPDIVAFWSWRTSELWDSHGGIEFGGRRDGNVVGRRSVSVVFEMIAWERLLGSNDV